MITREFLIIINKGIKWSVMAYANALFLCDYGCCMELNDGFLN